MKRNDIAESLSEIQDSYIREAARPRRRHVIPGAIAAVLALAILVLSLLPRAPEPAMALPEIPGSFRQLTIPAYPEMAAYPNGDTDEAGYEAWKASRLQQYDQPENYAAGTDNYFYRSLQTFLTAGDGNALCSPLNIYMVLAMAAETAGGNSRQQILDLLGCEDMDALRTQAGHIWNANYCADGATATVLASSLWASEGLPCNQQVMDSLSKYAYASAYQGDFRSPEYVQALQAWLARQTHGMLDTASVRPDPDTVLSLLSTLWYQEKWSVAFSPESSTEGIFHGTDGDSPCTFMNQVLNPDTYFWGPDFGACSIRTETGKTMWLILPDPDKTPADVLAAGDALHLALSGSESWTNRKQMKINLSLPKFDISATMDLTQGLQQLGVTDIFDPALADFSPAFPDTKGLFIGSVDHSIRTAIDEEGITAAAYTMLAYDGAAAPVDDEIDFVLDRPFLFILTTPNGLPLLAGTVGAL